MRPKGIQTPNPGSVHVILYQLRTTLWYLGFGEERGIEGLFLAQGPCGDVPSEDPCQQGQTADQALWGRALRLGEIRDNSLGLGTAECALDLTLYCKKGYSQTRSINSFSLMCGIVSFALSSFSSPEFSCIL